MQPAVCAFVVLALMGTGCGPRTPPSVEIDPALARLVPGDTLALIGVKVDALRATPLYGKWVAPRLDKLAKEKTLGVNKDVSELLLVSNGKNTVVFAKGKSSVFQLGSGVPPPRSKDGLPASLREKMRSIPPQSQIWAAGIGSLEIVNNAIPKEGNLANLRNVLSTIESWSAGADLRSGLKLEARGVYRTEADAKFIHDALRGLLGLGRLSTPDNAPELLRFYDGIQVTQQTSSVRVNADIPADVLDKFLARVSTSVR
jgi:hypothetical protein